MGNSLIFIEVFIVYQTWKQTDLFPSFSSFFIREKEERRFDKDSKKKKKSSNRNGDASLSLSLSFRRNFSILSQQFGPGTSRWVRGKSVYQQAEINRRWLIS